MVQNKMPTHIRNVLAQRLTVLADGLTPVATAQRTDILFHQKRMLPNHGSFFDCRELDCFSSIDQVLMINSDMPDHILIVSHWSVANFTTHVYLCKNKFVNPIGRGLSFFSKNYESLPKTYHVWESRMDFRDQGLEFMGHLFVLVTRWNIQCLPRLTYFLLKKLNILIEFLKLLRLQTLIIASPIIILSIFKNIFLFWCEQIELFLFFHPFFLPHNFPINVTLDPLFVFVVKTIVKVVCFVFVKLRVGRGVPHMRLLVERWLLYLFGSDQKLSEGTRLLGDPSLVTLHCVEGGRVVFVGPPHVVFLEAKPLLFAIGLFIDSDC